MSTTSTRFSLNVQLQQIDRETRQQYYNTNIAGGEVKIVGSLDNRAAYQMTISSRLKTACWIESSANINTLMERYKGPCGSLVSATHQG
jgi:hypothetical protein